jgi:hypothetical protein
LRKIKANEKLQYRKKQIDKSCYRELGMVAYVCDSNTWEAEAGELHV